MEVSLHTIFALHYDKGVVFKNLSFDFYEMILFLSGEGTTTVNGKEYSYGKNTICITKPNDIRDSVCTKRTDYICIRFGSLDVIDRVNSGVYSCNGKDFRELFGKIQVEVLAKEMDYLKICNLNILEILLKLSRMNVIDRKNEAFLEMIRSIDANPRDHKSIDEMAKKVAYSYDHFRHKFKEITGLSPTKYIINKRVEKACGLLSQGDYSCSEVSQICGFYSSAQFSSLFKSIIGITPFEYKKSYKG